MNQPLNSHYVYLTDWAAFGIAVGYILCDPQLSDTDKLLGLNEVARVTTMFDDCACGALKHDNVPTCRRCDSDT